MVGLLVAVCVCLIVCLECDPDLFHFPKPHTTQNGHGDLHGSSSSASGGGGNTNADPERLQQYIRTFERAIKEVCP